MLSYIYLSIWSPRCHRISRVVNRLQFNAVPDPSRSCVSGLDVVVPIRCEPDQACPIVSEWGDRWGSIAAALRPSRLNFKACPDKFICLIEEENKFI